MQQKQVREGYRIRQGILKYLLFRSLTILDDVFPLNVRPNLIRSYSNLVRN